MKSRAIPPPEVKKHFGRRVSSPVRSWCPRELYRRRTFVPFTTLLDFKTPRPLCHYRTVSARQTLRLPSALAHARLSISSPFYVFLRGVTTTCCFMMYLFLVCGLSWKRSPRNIGHGWALLIPRAQMTVNERNSTDIADGMRGFNRPATDARSKCGTPSHARLHLRVCLCGPLRVPSSTHCFQVKKYGCSYGSWQQLPNYHAEMLY